MWEDINVEKLKACVENKSEYDKLFPRLISEIGRIAKNKLKDKYPQVQEWVGPYAGEKVQALHPDMEEPFFLDWVCFGFEGYPPEEAHVGVLFFVNEWPITYTIGVHALDHIWSPREKEIKEKLNKLNNPPKVYDYQEAFKEHQFNDPKNELNYSDLNQSLHIIADRVEELYETVNPILKR